MTIFRDVTYLYFGQGQVGQWRANDIFLDDVILAEVSEDQGVAVGADEAAGVTQVSSLGGRAYTHQGSCKKFKSKI